MICTKKTQLCNRRWGDSVLIDDARTPLIISGPVPQGDRHEFNELKPKIENLLLYNVS
jgi:preprotein translocase subunit SecA